MNKIVFRFYEIKNNDFFEVSFDSRLSFIDNFRLLNEIYSIPINTIHIYDETSKTFLDMDIPIEKFGFSHYNKLFLFE